MNRREAIRQTALAAGAAALWAALPARTWAALAPAGAWSRAEEELLAQIADTILPATADSPGAAVAGVGRFITVMLADCLPPEASEAVRRGLREITERSLGRHGGEFATLSAGQREALLTAYEQEMSAATKAGAINPFRQIKELTLLGYFTSEAGATRALRYDPVPGAYRGSVPLAPGDRSWAT